MKVMRYVLGVILLGLTVPSWAAAIQPMTKGAEPGVWTTDFAAALAKSEAEHIPLLSFWGYEGCGYCGLMKSKALTSPEFAAWIQAHPILLVYTEVTESQTGVMTPVKQFTKNASGLFPYMRTYWPKVDGSVAGMLFTGREDRMGIKYGTLAQKLVARLEEDFGAWEPNSYAGGEFACDESVETPVHRLEAEAATRKLSVELVRSDAAAGVATNGTFKAYKPNGKDVLSTKTIKWEAGEKSQFVTIDLPADLFHSTNEVMKLEMVQGSEVKSTAHVYYVDAPVSAENPKWIGESFDFGEWTMDYVEATNRVAKTSGSAYTLVMVTGSLWCPNCYRFERNFLGLETNEVNRFEAWAKKNKVALAVVDVPYLTDGAWDKPTLLNAKPILGPLYSDDNGTSVKTNKSGLGYITRKEISTNDAYAVQTRFIELAGLDTAEGGFIRPEDTEDESCNGYRPRVPCFCLLRKDGTVAARLTRFTFPATPTTAERKYADNYLKRFDEMLAIATEGNAHADENECTNDSAGLGCPTLKANGGMVSGELCSADLRDAYKLDFEGNADQKVTVTGTSAATVEVSYWKVVDGKRDTNAMAVVEGQLKNGVTLTYEFKEKGDYYVQVKAANAAAKGYKPVAEFAPESDQAMNFISYTIKGNTVLVPGETRATANAPENADYVVVRLVKDSIYRFEGLDVAACAGSLEALEDGNFCKYFRATVTGERELKLLGGMGAAVDFQLWNAGTVAFLTVAQSVTESIGTVDVGVTRPKITGVSGAVTARVSLDPSTDLYDDFTHEPCFKFETTDLTWLDGESGVQTLPLAVIDDIYFNSGRKVVLKLEILTSDHGDVVVPEDHSVFTLNVSEDDRALPGQAMIADANTHFAKAKTIYVKQSQGAIINLARFGGVDGMVAIDVTASLNTVKLSAAPGNEDFWNLGNEYGVETGYWGWQYWKGRDGAIKPIKVSNLPAPGKSFKIKLAQILNKEYLGYDFKPYVASNSITIVSVSDSGLEFATPKDEISLARYVTFAGATCPLKTIPSGKVTFTKLSGTLPSGLKAAYDKNQNALVITGTTSAKPGVYTAVYQVKEGSVAGLTKELVFTVVDPTDAGLSPEVANPSVAVTRTLRDLPVLDETMGLVGRLTVTIPKRGNVSASYVSAAGTVSFTAKGWSEFDLISKALSVDLLCRDTNYSMRLDVNANGSIIASITDPNFATDLLVESSGVVWSKNENADAWKGYYTVALPVEKVVTEDQLGFAARGTGYLTLKLDSKSAINSGKVTWAGVLPNGKAVSGSTTLARLSGSCEEEFEENANSAVLPVFVRSATDILAVLCDIKANAKTSTDPKSIRAWNCAASGYWSHIEKDVEAAGDYLVRVGVYGGLYDKDADLGGCCADFYHANKLPIVFKGSSLGQTRYGIAEDAIANIDVQSTKIVLLDAPKGMTLSFNRTTGILSGNVKLPCENGSTISAKWRAVLLVGWGDACGCGDTTEIMPFVNGALTFTDRLTYEKSGRSRTLNVTRGAAVNAE